MNVDLKKQMTTRGYVKRSPEEIQESIIKLIKEKNPNFEKLPYDVQANLIDTAVAKILQYEGLVEIMINAYSFSGSNDFFFKQMGEELGLRMKNSYNSQVILRFRGLPGDIIPIHTKVSDSEGIYVFETWDRKVIGSTGEVDITAYGEADTVVGIGRLNKLVTVLSNGIFVSNPSPSMKKIEKETFDEYKFRAQARLRSPRMGGRLYAETCLKAIPGVDNRLISFYARDRVIEYDPDNPEWKDLDLDPGENKEDTVYPEEADGTYINDSIIARIKLVNEGETRPDITNLQEYVDAKYDLGVDIEDLEFVHLYNINTGVNNFIYYNGRWYEVKFSLPNSTNVMDGQNYNMNVEALDFDQVPGSDPDDVMYYCKSPAERVAFYANKTHKMTCLFGKVININNNNRPIKPKQFMRILGIESVVGGGDDYEVALALYQSFFETQKLISNPSDGDKERLKSIYLGLYNSSFPIKFTRPKLIMLNLKLSIAMLNRTTSALSVKKGTHNYLENNINSLKVGTDVTVTQLNQFIMPGFTDIDISPVEIKSMSWNYAIGEFKNADDENAKEDELVKWLDFDLDNKISEIAFDCYCVLVRYEVEIIG